MQDGGAAKKAVREAMKRLRGAVTPRDKALAEVAVSLHLLADPAMGALLRASSPGRAPVVATYLAFGAELDLSQFAAAAENCGARLAAPRREGGGYVLAALEDGWRETLVRGPMGIMEPPPQAPRVAPRDVSAWIVPGLAFAPDGTRTGYGGGWYDRFLAEAAPDALKYGVAYGFQISAELPRGPHDIPLDATFTPDGPVRVSSRRASRGNA